METPVVYNTYPLNRFPAESLALLVDAVAMNKNIHIQGNPGWGRGTLVRFLTSHLPQDEAITIVDESDRAYVYYDDSEQTITEIPSDMQMTDPAWIIMRPNPSALVINGDEVLKPQGRAYDFYSGTPYTESQIENFHENILWGMASTGTRVISAGLRSISDIETKVRKTRPNARIPCHVEVTVSPVNGNIDDGSSDYALEIKAPF